MFRKTSSRNRRSAWNRQASQAVECLEVRTLPAGNVAVSVVDGVLTIRGDDEANYVAIRQLPQTFSGAWPGASYEILTDVTVSRNIFKEAESPTAINGSRMRTSIQVSGVDRGVNINLHGGDDGLFIGSGDPANPAVNRERYSLTREPATTTCVCTLPTALTRGSAVATAMTPSCSEAARSSSSPSRPTTSVSTTPMARGEASD